MNKGVCEMSDFRKYLEKQLENEEFKAEHEGTRVEFNFQREKLNDEIKVSSEISK